MNRVEKLRGAAGPRLAVASPSPADVDHEAQLTAAALDAVGVGVVVIDDQRRLVRANAVSKAVLGVDLVSSIGTREWWRTLNPQRSGDGPAPDVAASVLRTGEAVRGVELSIDRPDGAVVSLVVDYVPLRTEPGSVTGVLLSFRELTRRSSWEWRPETDELVLFDPRSGGTDQLVGGLGRLEEVLALMPAEDRVDARENFAGFVRGDYDESVRLRPRELGGRETWLETRARAVRAEDGRLLSVRGTSQDVTADEISRRELIAARDFFQATLDSFVNHVAVLDEAGEVLTTNRSWKEYGAANGAVPGLGDNYFGVCDAAGEDEAARAVAAGLRAVAAGERQHFVHDYPCHHGEVHQWFTLRASRYDGAGPARVVVTHEDMTERHLAQQQILAQAHLLDEMDVAVIATDLARVVTHWNREAERLYGWTREEAIGCAISELVVPPVPGVSDEIYAALRDVGSWEGPFTVRRRDGTTFPAEVRNRMVVAPSGQPVGVVGVSVDITSRLASERALIEARDYMRAVADSMGQGLLTLDVDGRVSYANPAAELLLARAHEELLGRLLSDITVAGPGGGGPAAWNDSTTNARPDCASLRVEDAAFLRGDGSELPVAFTAAPFETATGVQGCVVLFEDISERKAYEAALLQDAEKLDWIDRVQQALTDDRFVLYAQPIIDLQSREVVQRELLLRMREPDGSIVGPGAFLPVAEKYGLIGDVDWWVIEQAVALAATGCAVELNVSARSVGDPAILEHIERCLEESDVDPSLIVFEITETALVEDEAAASVFADRIHALGSKLALDDFGTGYGTFTYLKRLPVDFLKIDIEFVRDLASNRASHHVVQAVVALASAFGLQTIAEGVEDAETLELLTTLGVDFAQGYHIARPGPMAAG